MHQRRKIREAIKDKLFPSFANKVFVSRVYPVEDDDLPCALVYVGLNEDIASDTMGLRTIERTVEIIVECVAQVNDTVDDVLDQCAVEVERLLGTDPTLASTCRDCILVRSQFAFRKDGERETGSVVLTYLVSYRTTLSDPENHV